jgi:putative Mg2+ transporter-C (MgtC) family protein
LRAVLVGCTVGLDLKLHGKPTGVQTLELVALGIVCVIGAWQIEGIATALLLLLLSVDGSVERGLHRRWLRTPPDEQAAITRHKCAASTA